MRRFGLRLLVGPLFLFVVTGCFGGDNSRPWPPEVNEISGLSLDERQITARVDGSTAAISVTLERTTVEDVSGRLFIDLVDLSGDEDRVVGSAELGFELTAAEATYDLQVGGIDASLDRDDLARYLIQYRVRSSGDEIYGARDLWVALPKAELQLLAPSELPAGGSVYARAFVRDPATGRALEGASVQVTYTPTDGVEETLAEATTDAHGAATMLLEAADVVSSGELRALATAGELTAQVIRPINVTKNRTVLLTTDKPRYQPGQTMHLRVLALGRDDRVPAATEEVLFEVRDAKGNKVFKERISANEFGIAAIRVPLADELNFGEWTIRAAVSGSESERTVVVERYTLPKFKVTVTADQPYYRPGDRVMGTVAAVYFFGRTVDGTVRVEAQVVGGESDLAVASTQGQLVDGGFAFELDLPGNLQLESGGRSLRLLAQVTDTAAQAVDSSASFPLSAGDLEVAIIPEGRLALGIPSRMIVAVTDPTGTPVSAQVSITGVTSLTLGDAGIGSFLYTPTANQLPFQVSAEAADGRRVSKVVPLGEPAAEALVIRTDRAVYSVGETARIEVLATARAPSRIALDLGRAGRAVLTRDVELVDRRALIEVPITADLAGALTIEAAYAGGGGQVVSDSRTVFVDAANELTVEVSAPATTAPGEPAVIDLAVRGTDGSGVPAAVGIAIVDEAVFALSDSRPGAEAVRLAFAGGAPAPIAGHAVSEILNGDASTREAAARLLFAAAGGGAAYGLDVNTYREELQVVRAVADARFGRTVDELAQRLYRDAGRGLVTEENGASYIVARALRTADVFGRPLLAESTDLWNVTVTSSGPDEVMGSADDSTRSLSVWNVIYNGSANQRGGGGWGAEDDGDVAFADGAEPTAGGPPPAPGEGGADKGTAATRVRAWFPETLLVEPSVITDGSGRATLPLTVADSITNWKIAAGASSIDGRVGSGEGDLIVFQEFFADMTLPPALTKDDEIDVPVAVYNYRSESLTVTLEVQPEPWFELLSGSTQVISLGPDEVRGASFRIRATGVGVKGLTVLATSAGVSDAVRRSVLVQPGGEKIDAGVSGRIGGTIASGTISFPPSAIPGGNKLAVKIYPGVMSQTVEGMDAILSEPHGCFEQSTSTTWPNVMVAEYMDVSGTGTPETMERAKTFIQKGYQLLVSYEAPSGGFNWWGNDDPGNKILTAIGILILRDMEAVIEVDDALVARSAAWLASQQEADGSWPKGDALHMGNDFLSEDAAIVTAFAVEALAVAGGQDAAVQRGIAYLEGRVRSGIDAPFTLAAAARSLARAGSTVTGQALASLYDMATVDAEGHFTWQSPSNHSWSGATGENAGLETTAIAAQAFIYAGAYPDAADGALGYLAKSKNSLGTWSQTQATVQALRAFTASVVGAGAPDVDGVISVLVDGVEVGSLSVDPDTSDVVRNLDLSQYAAGDKQVDLQFIGRGQLMFQMVGVHHLPWGAARTGGGIGIDVQHTQTQMTVGATDTVSIVVQNLSGAAIDQVLVKAGLAPGQVPSATDLNNLVAAGSISRWERSATGVVLYVPRVEGGQSATFTFGATATLSGDFEAPATVAYGYYNPDQKAVSPPVAFAITE